MSERENMNAEDLLRVSAMRGEKSAESLGYGNKDNNAYKPMMFFKSLTISFQINE